MTPDEYNTGEGSGRQRWSYHSISYCTLFKRGGIQICCLTQSFDRLPLISVETEHRSYSQQMRGGWG